MPRIPFVRIVLRSIVSVIFVSGVSVLTAADPAPLPLPHAHAHNDYWHERPLFDALDAGFCSVEADVFLVDGQLLVGHDRHELRPERTLQTLYLDPLRERVKANGGHVFPNGPGFSLLIDVKSDAEETYAVLHTVLAKYSGILTTIRDGKREEKAVTIIISGGRDFDTLIGQPVRYAGLDGRISDLDGDLPAQAMPWISDNWNLHFRWYGDGPMPDEQRKKLRAIVSKAHADGRRVRFWGTLDKEGLWNELLAADVDLIGTDNLPKLSDYLQKQRSAE